MTAPRPMRAARRAPFDLEEFLDLAWRGEAIREASNWAAWNAPRADSVSYRDHARGEGPPCASLAWDPDPVVAGEAARALLAAAERSAVATRDPRFWPASSWPPHNPEAAAQRADEDAARWRARLDELAAGRPS